MSWCSYHYDAEGKLQTTYSRLTEPCYPLRQALRKNARATVDAFPGEPLALMFSGGLDSELMVRAFKDIGHPFKAYTFRYDNGYNEYDVIHAHSAAEVLGVELITIDINATHFFENDALDFMDTIRCSHVRALLQPKFMDKVDGVPLYGTGDPRFYRPSEDYTKPCEWLVQDNEYEIAWTRYAEQQGRKADMQWLRFTPHFVASVMALKWFQELTSDCYPGKLGVNSTKLEGYFEAYPSLLPRTKQTGFEKMDHLVTPVEDAHRKRHDGMPWMQTCERTLSQFKEDLWGTRQN